jgi:uncharacterized protein YgiM (DUF1202 family)
VFINDARVGRTPYQTLAEAGEISLKLVPDSGDKPLADYTTRVLLSSGIKTIVNRTFAETEAVSSGEVISFEKAIESEAALAVVADPDSAQVSIDGAPRGFAPYKTSALSVGQHQVGVSAPGFLERTLAVNTLTGYKLTLIVKLAQTEAAVQPGPTPGPTPKPITIKILSTPNGFLRVREKPEASAKEVGRVKPGDTFPLIEANADSSWYEIQYDASDSAKIGWVSGQYVSKIE